MVWGLFQGLVQGMVEGMVQGLVFGNGSRIDLWKGLGIGLDNGLGNDLRIVQRLV